MRSYFLLSYDISNPKRWRKVFRAASDFGDPLQYSVFLCLLSEKDHIVLQSRIIEAISKEDDRVLLIRLRTAKDVKNLVESFGKPFEMPEKRFFIC